MSQAIDSPIGLDIERRAVADLAADPANVRRHDDRNIEAIVGSLRRFGQQKPIVVDADGIVRAGNGTLEAARRIGWPMIDCVVTNLTGSEATAYAIADNRSAELADWDADGLAAQLEALAGEDPDLAAAAGYLDAELAELAAALAGADPVDPESLDDPPPPELPADPVTKRGDVWQLGNHRLICGDATSAADLATLFAGQRARICFTSPPYADQRTYANDAELAPEHLAAFIPLALKYCDVVAVNLGVSRVGGQVVPYWDHYTAAAKAAGAKLVSWNIWDRGHAGSVGMATACFPIEHEWIFVFALQPPELTPTIKNKHAGETVAVRIRNADGSQTDPKTFTKRDRRELGTIVRTPVVHDNGAHPAQFPVALPAAYLQAIPGDVCDLFAGYGTTLLAAEQLGARKFFGAEINPGYCDLIVDRWQQMTGQSVQRVPG